MKTLLKFVSMALLLVISITSQAALTTNEIRDAYKASYQYEKTQNYKDAIKAISIIALHYEKTYTVNLRLGYLYYLNKQYANAIKHYKVAHKALPKSVTPLLGEMSVGIAKASYSDAEQAGFNILKSDLYNYYANLKLAYIFIKQKKLDTAKKLLNKMLSKYPEDVAFLSQYAQIYVAKKDYESASAMYQNILILDPENIAANYYFSLAKKQAK